LEEHEDFFFEGQTDKNGFPVGTGLLTFLGNDDDNLDTCIGGVCEAAISKISGTFCSNGDLCGQANVTFTNENILRGSFQNGALHGFAAKIDVSGLLLEAGQYRQEIISLLYSMFK